MYSTTDLVVGLTLTALLTLVFAMGWLPMYEGFAVATRMLCPTRNTSLDLRGDPIRQKRVSYPFNSSAIGPLRPELCPL